jgi:hypothetical protein
MPYDRFAAKDKVLGQMSQQFGDKMRMRMRGGGMAGTNANTGSVDPDDLREDGGNTMTGSTGADDMHVLGGGNQGATTTGTDDMHVLGGNNGAVGGDPDPTEAATMVLADLDEETLRALLESMKQ